jgi:hypothetical protein
MMAIPLRALRRSVEMEAQAVLVRRLRTGTKWRRGDAVAATRYPSGWSRHIGSTFLISTPR